MTFSILIPTGSLYFSNIKRVRQDILNCFVIDRSGNFWESGGINITEHFLFRPSVAGGLLRQALLLRPFTKLREAPLACGVEFKNSLHDRGAFGVKGLV